MKGKKDSEGEPYFIHPFETAKILAKLGMDTQTILPDLLHDTLEDTKITRKQSKKNLAMIFYF
jgi:guanosine-3',5'-bis(diphosphate) 3'-pyrophosphohydrolase